jgi:ABC-type sugar transport system substrate-binding protein
MTCQRSVALTDFGLAKLVDREDESLTHPGNIVGTPTYMAPEQLRGEPVDHRADIYSLGVILFQMLTGKPPFVSEENEIISVIYQHLERVPPLPSDINPDLPPEVDSVILKALEKKPEDRYDHVGEMTNALRIAAGLDPTSTRDFPAVGSGQPMLPIQTSRQPRTVMAGVAILSVLIVTAIIVGLLALRDDGELPQPIIMAGEIGGLEATLPTDDEITTALRRLGDEGFVGLVTCNRTSEYHAGTAREIVEFLDGYGIETRIYDSQNIEARQIPLIEQARSDGAAGLIICPLNIELLDEQLTSIEEAKMPLVLFSTGDNHYGGVYIEGDNYLLGLKPGQFAGEIIRDEMDGQADVVVLDFPDLPNIVRRADGLVDGVLEVAPEANIVARVRGGTQTFGHDSIETLLADGVEFDVIVSINDDGSIGAIAAMDEAGIPPEAVVVVSIDAEALAKQYIEQRYYMRGSVAIDRTTSSQAMAGAMVRMLGGGTLPAQISLPPGDVVTREILQSDDA